MATVKYYLDTRATKPGCPAPIRLAIRICNSAAYLTTGVCVLPSEWNATLGKVVANRRRQFFNDYLEQFRMQVVNLMFDLKLKGELYALSARQIRDRYLSSVAKTVVPRVSPPGRGVFVWLCFRPVAKWQRAAFNALGGAVLCASTS